MTKTKVLYRRATTEASNDGMADSFRSHRCVLHKGTMRRYPRAMRFQRPRFETPGNWPVLPRFFDANALVLNAISSRGDLIKKTLWPQH
ncbi:MAG: hypothetical protein DME62_10085 [Verrucomicrobia bacterium]|nr:MAG: hypothetical protein DME62_10085 [Verrucomicrobiota bacterium]